jgi:hypothetical protein
LKFAVTANFKTALRVRKLSSSWKSVGFHDELRLSYSKCCFEVRRHGELQNSTSSKKTEFVVEAGRLPWRASFFLLEVLF